MHRGLGAGREQGFEQLSFEICASTLDDVPVSHRLTIQAYLNSPRTQRQLGYCLSYLDDHATLKLDGISGFRFGAAIRLVEGTFARHLKRRNTHIAPIRPNLLARYCWSVYKIRIKHKINRAKNCPKACRDTTRRLPNSTVLQAVARFPAGDLGRLAAAPWVVLYCGKRPVSIPR